MQILRYTILAMLFLFTACDKENDSTGVNSKVVGNWELNKYLINNADSTTQFLADYPNYQMQFAANSTVKVVYKNPGNGQLTTTFGIFNINENDTELEIIFNGAPIQTGNVLQLDDNVLRYQYTAAGDSIERRFLRVQ